MCQAIVKPKNILIEKRVLRKAWQDNPDGAGLAYRRENHTVLVAKGYMHFKAFWQAYRQIEHLDVLLHFRYATHGTVNRENCHPFLIGEQSAMVHNGILSRFEPLPGDTRSDTRCFVDDCLMPAITDAQVTPREYLTDRNVKATFQRIIGGSKLAFLTPEGFTIYNEGLGEWHGGVWYSAGYPARTTSATYGYADRYDSDDWFDKWDAYQSQRDTPQDYDSGPVCIVCSEPSRNLYQVGADMVCNECWHAYAS